MFHNVESRMYRVPSAPHAVPYNIPMTDSASTILEWTYEPRDFFEEAVDLAMSDGRVYITAGNARGEFGGTSYDQGHSFRDAAHSELSVFFMAHQVNTAKPFTLSLASMHRLHADRRRDHTLFVEAGVLSITSLFDFVLRDAEGNVKRDSKAERRATHYQLRDNATQLYKTDHVMRRILQSFHNAQSDPDNMLVHLYEIQECLETTLGHKEKLCKKLGLDVADWNRLKIMANEEPLFEGRHRGKHPVLRHATADALRSATSFAQTLIQ